MALHRLLIDGFPARIDAWQVGATLAASEDLDAQGFHFDSVSQTHMPNWTDGNVAVVGDSRHCAALLSGTGTTLAMVSTEALTETWTDNNGNMRSAAPIVYHERLVDQCQAFAHEGAPIMNI